MRLVLGAARLPMLGVLRLAVARVPRDARLVVLGTPLDRFADNSAYLFLHLSTRADHSLTAVWISGSRELVERLRRCGYRAELRWSPGGVRTCLRAGTFAYSAYRSDINQWLSSGAFALCLWHGIPIKRIERGAEDSGASHRVRRLTHRLGREPAPDALLSSTDHVTRSLMAPAFGIPAHRCWELGYPRNDHLLNGPDAPPSAALVPDRTAWDELQRRRPVVGLFLTWRDDRATDVADEDLVGRLAEVCGQRGAVLAYKPHFNVAGAQVLSNDCVALPGDADLNAYLGLCDVLVTDYSSAAIDFVLLRRPILYYMPDLEDYARTRGFAVDPHGLPGTITRTASALLDELDSLLSGDQGPPTRHGTLVAADAFTTSMWGGYDGHAAAAVATALQERAVPPVDARCDPGQ